MGPFFKAHAKRYRKRPVYWLLQSPKQNFSVYFFHERATDQTLALLQGKRYLGGRIFQLEQHVEEARQKELTADGREKAQLRKRAHDLAEELVDMEAFQRAIEETNNEQVIGVDSQPTTARWVPEFDDGVLLNAALLHRLTPSWKRADAKLDVSKAWKDLKEGMAALLPSASTGLELGSANKWQVSLHGRVLKNRADRIAYLKDCAGVPVADLKLEDPRAFRRKLKELVEGPALILVTSREIDQSGEDEITVAREHMERVLTHLGLALRKLVEEGVERFIITADHGYLYGEDLAESEKLMRREARLCFCTVACGPGKAALPVEATC